jgi:hypothetical protein
LFIFVGERIMHPFFLILLRRVSYAPCATLA